MKLIIACLAIILCSIQDTLQNRCYKKLFDGRPREYRKSAGFEIAYYPGYWTLAQCQVMCVETEGCGEFRIKKNPKVKYSGCVTMKSGTTYSGFGKTSYTMYKLVPCCSKKESYKLVVALTQQPGYWTRAQCEALCKQTYGCTMFRIKNNATVEHGGGCLTMKGGGFMVKSTKTHTLYELGQC
jgi:hypothetical protein